MGFRIRVRVIGVMRWLGFTVRLGLGFGRGGRYPGWHFGGWWMCRGRAYVWQPRYTGPAARRVAARDRMAVGIPEGYFCMRYFFGTVPEMVRSIAIGAFVCLSAGVYLKNHTRPDFTNFSVCAICGRGSVLHCCALPVL